MPPSGRTHNKCTPSSSPLREQGRYRDHWAQCLEVVSPLNKWHRFTSDWFSAKHRASAMQQNFCIFSLVAWKWRCGYAHVGPGWWSSVVRTRVLLRSLSHAVGKSRMSFLSCFHFFLPPEFSSFFQRLVPKIDGCPSPLHLSTSRLLAPLSSPLDKISLRLLEIYIFIL